MSGRLSGKRALVTAAGAGIGHATALAFAQAGAQVLATDIDSGALASLMAEHPSLATKVLDVTQADSIAALVSTSGPFDVLFNCAGYVHAGSILDTDDDGWRRSFTINVDSMFHLCKAVLPGMLERGKGSIINMASVASSVKGVPNRFWLWRHQGRRDRPDPFDRSGFRRARRALQRDLSGHGENTVAGRARTRAWRRRSGALAKLRRAPTDGTSG